VDDRAALMTIYFSLIRYNLMQPEEHGFIGWPTIISSSPTHPSGRP